jgi:hypothetical protein
VLRTVLATATDMGFHAAILSTSLNERPDDDRDRHCHPDPWDRCPPHPRGLAFTAELDAVYPLPEGSSTSS